MDINFQSWIVNRKVKDVMSEDTLDSNKPANVENPVDVDEL